MRYFKLIILWSTAIEKECEKAQVTIKGKDIDNPQRNLYQFQDLVINAADDVDYATTTTLQRARFYKGSGLIEK